jgi:hypothetical protein
MNQIAISDLSPLKAYWTYRGMARDHERAGRLDAAFSCLEAAHILGQRRTALHVGAHVAMWRLALRQRDVKEIAGQSLRIVAAAIITWIWVPGGNTGRSNVSAFEEIPIPDDLRQLLSEPEDE